jgi:hypothetical protein
MGQLELGLAAIRAHTPSRPTIVAACAVCGRKSLTSEATFVHPTCLAKPKPCECGAASMPYPNCAHCAGSGRLPEGGLVCPYCPPGPCVDCVARALLARCRDART